MATLQEAMDATGYTRRTIQKLVHAGTVEGNKTRDPHNPHGWIFNIDLAALLRHKNADRTRKASLVVRHYWEIDSEGLICLNCTLPDCDPNDFRRPFNTN